MAGQQPQDQPPGQGLVDLPGYLVAAEMVLVRGDQCKQARRK